MKQCVNDKLEEYLNIIGNVPATGLHKLFIQEVEKALIECVLDKNNHNQTKSAQVLGINRSTLRTKIKYYGI